MLNFGVDNFDNVSDDNNMFIRRGISFCHRDYDKLTEPYTVMSGFMPSGPIHLGHKMVIDQIVYHQNIGAQSKIVIADVEAHVTRGIPWDKCEEICANYIHHAKKLGFKGSFEWQSDIENFGLEKQISGMVNFSTLRAIYGFTDSTSVAQMNTVITQCADILSIPGPVLIPAGIDQDPHIRLARDIARKLGFELPSAIYHTYMKGLKNGKMSSSISDSYVSLDDNYETLKPKIMNMYTGGQNSISKQVMYGGNPEVCTVYELCKVHLLEDDNDLLGMYENCKLGNMLCGGCKVKVLELMS